jgi:hypothetical protein
MEFILKAERNNSYFFNLNNWCNTLNLFPENFGNVKENAISFDEFIRYADSFVRSLEQQDTFLQGAWEDEPLHDRLQ